MAEITNDRRSWLESVKEDAERLTIERIAKAKTAEATKAAEKASAKTKE